jgi:hypothetical protein
MKIKNFKLVSSGAMASDITSTEIDLDQIYGLSIQAVYTGSPVGNLIVQVTNYTGEVEGTATWSTFGTPTTINAAGNTALNLPDIMFKRARIFWDVTSGSGSLDVFIMLKSV